MLTFLRGIGLFVVVLGVVSAQMLPDVQAMNMNELAHLYFDNNGPVGFTSGITPCSNYVDLSTGLNNNTLGRQTAAQWIRTAFHDFVTADVAAGTGGLDASVGFEALRPENVGPGIDDSLIFFAVFFNARVSMSDLIALGTALAVGACGGPAIALRGGRIDATGPGPAGVPEPQTDIKTTLASFAGAGFNQADAIGLTACGHTMGGVHHANFPDVVPESAVGPDNADGRIAFDDTVAVFDINEVTQYLDGTGLQGGPLVTSSNISTRADLRLFSSDGNSTIRKLGQSSNQFRSTCSSLITQMIDTVPKGVTMTPLIDPNGLGYANLSLTVDWSGKMTLSGFMRYIEVSEYASAPKSLTVTIIDRKEQITKNSVTVISDGINYSTGVYGPTYHYFFSVSFPASSGLSGMVVNGQRFQLQDTLFVIRTLSSISPGFAVYNIIDPAHEFTFNITAALLSSHPPPSLKGTISVPVPQPGNVSPKIDSSTITQLGLIGTAGPYAIYSVVLSLDWSSLQLFGATIDVVNEEGEGAALLFKLFDILQFF